MSPRFWLRSSSAGLPQSCEEHHPRKPGRVQIISPTHPRSVVSDQLISDESLYGLGGFIDLPKAPIHRPEHTTRTRGSTAHVLLKSRVHCLETERPPRPSALFPGAPAVENPLEYAGASRHAPGSESMGDTAVSRAEGTGSTTTITEIDILWPTLLSRPQSALRPLQHNHGTLALGCLLRLRISRPGQSPISCPAGSLSSLWPELLSPATLRNGRCRSHRKSCSASA